jgi:hypothetical protein
MTNLAENLADEDLDQSTMAYVSLFKDDPIIVTQMLVKHKSKANDKKLLPPNSRLLTTDATAMYTNIEPFIGVQAIIDLIASLGNKLPPTFTSQLIVDTLRLVMTSNVFQIDATFWWQ